VFPHFTVRRHMQGSSAYRPELEPSQQSTSFAQLPPEQQQLLEEENRALVTELTSLNQSARSIESTMRDVQQLSQMFSAQVMQQAEQIEQLYQQVSSPTSFLSVIPCTVDVNRCDIALGCRMPFGSRRCMLLVSRRCMSMLGRARQVSSLQACCMLCKNLKREAPCCRQ
jgi:hypothetical protein